MQEVHGRRRRLPRKIELNRARKALKELSDLEEGRDQELKEARARRRPGPFARPGLFASPDLSHLGA